MDMRTSSLMATARPGPCVPVVFGSGYELSFWREFEAALPKLVGAIMDALVIGLKNLPKTKPANLPRMADYAIWGTACETAYTEPGHLMEAIALARTESVEDVLEASVAAQVLREHLQTKVF